MLISRKKTTIRHRHVHSTIFYTHDNPSSEQPSIQKRYLQCTREKREISRETVLVSCETSLVSRDTSLVSREKVVTYIWAVLYICIPNRMVPLHNGPGKVQRRHFSRDESSLTTFVKYLNGVEPSIRFTHEISYKSVNFLDTKVIKDVQGNISTDIFQEPTDTHPYLHWT